MTERRARRKPGENWERLLQAGLHEFGLYGYHGTSTASIAARAEVPQPHLYANFDGKADLFLLCIDVAIASLADSSAGSSAVRVASPQRELIVFHAVAVLMDPTVGAAVRARLAGDGALLDDALARACVVAAGALTAGALTPGSFTAVP